MISEGFLTWKMTPWLRRLITRSIAITPCIIVAGAVGRDGLAQVLNASQVALSILLPFVSAPLIYFTCRKQYMLVKIGPSDPASNSTAPIDGVEGSGEPEVGAIPAYFDMSNNRITTAFALVIWGFMTFLNGYLIVTLAMGNGGG
jgi:metal iron transporter